MKYKLFTKTVQEIRRQLVISTVVDFLSDDKLQFKGSTLTELRVLSANISRITNVHIQHSNTEFMHCATRVRRYLYWKKLAMKTW